VNENDNKNENYLQNENHRYDRGSNYIAYQRLKPMPYETIFKDAVIVWLWTFLDTDIGEISSSSLT